MLLSVQSRIHICIYRCFLFVRSAFISLPFSNSSTRAKHLLATLGEMFIVRHSNIVKHGEINAFRGNSQKPIHPINSWVSICMEIGNGSVMPKSKQERERKRDRKRKIRAHTHSHCENNEKREKKRHFYQVSANSWKRKRIADHQEIHDRFFSPHFIFIRFYCEAHLVFPVEFFGPSRLCRLLCSSISLFICCTFFPAARGFRCVATL